MRYAFFPDERRLLIEDHDTLTTYADMTHSSSSERQLISQDIMSWCAVAWLMTRPAT